MWFAEDVIVRRDFDMSALGAVPSHVDYGIMSLNKDFFELAMKRDDAVAVVEEESEFLERLEAVGEDWDAIVDLLDERYEDLEETSALDAGMAGAVAALSALGAFTISSCNGGVIGDSHKSEVPHVLFACGPNVVATIEFAAAAVGCGLINNDGFLELFADDLRNMNRFARKLLEM